MKKFYYRLKGIHRDLRPHVCAVSREREMVSAIVLLYVVRESTFIRLVAFSFPHHPVFGIWVGSIVF